MDSRSLSPLCQEPQMMILTILQIGTVPAVTALLVSARMGARRRNTQSWDSLLARLEPDWSARNLSDHFLWKEGLCTTTEETWEGIQGARGLRAMYKNAGVMLEIADYASRNSDSIDEALLAALRSDATQIRAGAMKALALHVFSHASEGVRSNAFQVASMYTGMVARMTQLMVDSRSEMLPSFIAAM
jgi:hypothetical protein